MPNYTRPAKPGRVEKQAFSEFFGEGIRTGSNANDSPHDVPPRTSLRSFDPPPANCVWGG